MAHFGHINQPGKTMFFHFDDFTINLTHLVSVLWDEEEQCASVTMAIGEAFDIDGDYYQAFKKVMGRA